MRGIKIRKKAFMASVIAALFLITPAIMPTFAQGAVVSAPVIFDPTLGPGTAFTANIMVSGAENLWGFQFSIYWNPDVLGATGFSIEPPLNTMWPSYVGVGEATIAASLPLGFETGIYGDWLLARLFFQVLDDGSTFLDLQDVTLVNPDGNPCPIAAVTDGFFANVEPKYRVEVQRAYAEHRDWVESADLDNTLTANVRNFGTMETEANVIFTFTDEAGTWSYSEAIPVTLKSKQKLDVTLDVTRSWLLLHGAPPPIYGAYGVTVKVSYHDLDLNTWLTGRLVKTVSFTLSP